MPEIEQIKEVTQSSDENENLPISTQLTSNQDVQSIQQNQTQSQEKTLTLSSIYSHNISTPFVIAQVSNVQSFSPSTASAVVKEKYAFERKEPMGGENVGLVANCTDYDIGLQHLKDRSSSISTNFESFHHEYRPIYSFSKITEHSIQSPLINNSFKCISKEVNTYDNQDHRISEHSIKDNKISSQKVNKHLTANTLFSHRLSELSSDRMFHPLNPTYSNNMPLSISSSAIYETDRIPSRLCKNVLSNFSHYSSHVNTLLKPTVNKRYIPPKELSSLSMQQSSFNRGQNMRNPSYDTEKPVIVSSKHEKQKYVSDFNRGSYRMNDSSSGSSNYLENISISKTFSQEKSCYKTDVNSFNAENIKEVLSTTPSSMSYTVSNKNLVNISSTGTYHVSQDVNNQVIVNDSNFETILVAISNSELFRPENLKNLEKKLNTSFPSTSESDTLVDLPTHGQFNKIVFVQNSDLMNHVISNTDNSHIHWYPINNSDQDIKDVATQTTASFLSSHMPRQDIKSQKGKEYVNGDISIQKHKYDDLSIRRQQDITIRKNGKQNLASFNELECTNLGIVQEFSLNDISLDIVHQLQNRNSNVEMDKSFIATEPFSGLSHEQVHNNLCNAVQYLSSNQSDSDKTVSEKNALHVNLPRKNNQLINTDDLQALNYVSASVDNQQMISNEWNREQNNDATKDLLKDTKLIFEQHLRHPSDTTEVSESISFQLSHLLDQASDIHGCCNELASRLSNVISHLDDIQNIVELPISRIQSYEDNRTELTHSEHTEPPHKLCSTTDSSALDFSKDVSITVASKNSKSITEQDIMQSSNHDSQIQDISEISQECSVNARNNVDVINSHRNNTGSTGHALIWKGTAFERIDSTAVQIIEQQASASGNIDLVLMEQRLFFRRKIGNVGGVPVFSITPFVNEGSNHEKYVPTISERENRSIQKNGDSHTTDLENHIHLNKLESKETSYNGYTSEISNISTSSEIHNENLISSSRSNTSILKKGDSYMNNPIKLQTQCNSPVIDSSSQEDLLCDINGQGEKSNIAIIEERLGNINTVFNNQRNALLKLAVQSFNETQNFAHVVENQLIEGNKISLSDQQREHLLAQAVRNIEQTRTLISMVEDHMATRENYYATLVKELCLQTGSVDPELNSPTDTLKHEMPYSSNLNGEITEFQNVDSSLSSVDENGNYNFSSLLEKSSTSTDSAEDQSIQTNNLQDIYEKFTPKVPQQLSWHIPFYNWQINTSSKPKSKTKSKPTLQEAFETLRPDIAASIENRRRLVHCLINARPSNSPHNFVEARKKSTYGLASKKERSFAFEKTSMPVHVTKRMMCFKEPYNQMQKRQIHSRRVEVFSKQQLCKSYKLKARFYSKKLKENTLKGKVSWKIYETIL